MSSLSSAAEPFTFSGVKLGAAVPAVAPKVYRRGRRCAHEGCTTILSMYNSADRCELHRDPPKPKRRGSPGTKHNQFGKAVPAGPVTRHVAALLAAGLSPKDIAARSGVSLGHVYKLKVASLEVVGDATEAKILAVTS